MKILIIEDNEFVINTIKFTLLKDGYEIFLALDGKEGKKLLSQNKFDLVITDIMLPFITGIELLAYIKSNFTNLPVIILSSSDQESTILDAFELGVDDFISKPFSPRELSVRVKRILKSAVVK